MKVSYTYVPGYVLTVWNAAEILRAMSSGLREVGVVVDMGLASIVARFSGDSVYLGEGVEVPISELMAVEEGFAYKVLAGRLVRLDMYDSGKYYKLKPTAPGNAPALEINGIQMHRTVGVDPWTDAVLKVSALGRLSGAEVLDVCTGLGYTAIAEVAGGAKRVLTVEADSNVFWIAQHNPWSRSLGCPSIEIALKDATEYVKELESEKFDAVLHDPPRISVAGELYSLEFYVELYRVLKPGGRVFHYVGEPGKHGNISFLKGVKSRLELAGFVNVKWVERAKGFSAVKPRSM